MTKKPFRQQIVSSAVAIRAALIRYALIMQFLFWNIYLERAKINRKEAGMADNSFNNAAINGRS